jgi:hypothetical protein
MAALQKRKRLTSFAKTADSTILAMLPYKVEIRKEQIFIAHEARR